MGRRSLQSVGRQRVLPPTQGRIPLFSYVDARGESFRWRARVGVAGRKNGRKPARSIEDAGDSGKARAQGDRPITVQAIHKAPQSAPRRVGSLCP